MLPKSFFSLFLLMLLFNSTIAISQNEYTSFSEKTRTLYNSKKYLELIDYANSELKEVIKVSDSVAIAKLYFEKAKGLYHKSRQDESIEALKRANLYLVNVENHMVLKADIMYFLYINYGLKSYILKELEYGQKSLELYEKVNVEERDINRLFIIYRRLANPNVTIGNYEIAKQLIDKAEQLLDNLPDKHNFSEPLVNYKINLGYQKVVVDLIETAFYPDNYDSISIKRITQRVIKEKKKQDSIYLANTKLVNGKRVKTDPRINFGSYASTLNFYCRYLIVNQDKIDFDLSLLHPDINRSIELLPKESYGRLLELFKGNRVDVLEYQKKYDEALVLMDTIIADAGENHNRYVNFLLQKARILCKKEDYDSGKVWITKGIEKIHIGEEPLQEDYSNFVPGYKLEDVFLFQSVADKIIFKVPLKDDEKDKELAILYELAFKQFLNTYNTAPLNKRTQNVFKTIVQNLVKYDRLDKETISQIEHIENRLAWKEFNQSRNVVQLPVVDSLEQIEFRIRRQIIQAKRMRQERQIDSLRDELLTFQNKMEQAYPTVFQFTQDNFDIEEFQNKMGENEVVLKYLFFRSQFAVFQITKNEVRWFLKPWGLVEQDLVSSHLRALKNLKNNMNSVTKLTEILIPQEALDYKNITIVPDQPIYFLPFETLKYNDEYLVERKAIKYSSHLRFVFSSHVSIKDIEESQATIFAPNYAASSTKLVTRSEPVFLKGAQQEAEVLESLFPSKSFIGQSATKENFISNKSGGNILHMAMHATIDKENPGFSHFNFSKGEKLYLEELYALNIPADLAVLSACNTAVGKEDASLSINSLHRAFNYSGTEATIASLWEVPDETTSEIMISFYKYLKKGKTKSTALQKAKKDYLNSKSDNRLNHPYYWAGFVLYGADNPVAEPSSLSLWLFIIGVVFIFVVLLWKKTRHSN